MKWKFDTISRTAAFRVPLPLPQPSNPSSPIPPIPAPQFQGRVLRVSNWSHRVNGSWPAVRIRTTPQAIINTFSTGDYLKGLALVIVWGTMWRGNRRIYAAGNRQIDAVLRRCDQSIQNNQTAQQAWNFLTSKRPNGLGWSEVLTSKVLHFMARVRGFQKVPVPLDNAIIRNKIWPAWESELKKNGHPVPGAWKGNSYQAFNRYMSAIDAWAAHYNLTYSQMEATIFAHYK